VSFIAKLGVIFNVLVILTGCFELQLILKKSVSS